ncbi:hypothetical protein C1H46_027387 [Malus baccata]|uniref:Uncharacterized protein n=1 Tax=Malus baccata TaxID=106549 RepID=A0A540LL55_MALBA|nr:hypothetical protein C1H46_027387 [Malus baccata]
MDSISSCNQRSPSLDRLLSLFSFFPPSSAASAMSSMRLRFSGPSISLSPLSTPQTPASKPTISSSSKLIPSIPRLSPSQSQSQSVPNLRKLQSSALMTVPILSRSVEKHCRNDSLVDVVDDEDWVDDEMMPPHELVARGSGVSDMTMFSVLEDVGMTLKGRDLRQVKNAIWSKIEFLD